MVDVSKLLNVVALQKDTKRGMNKKLCTDYSRLNKQVKEYDGIKQNIDSILRQIRELERKNGKNVENSFVHTYMIQ